MYTIPSNGYINPWTPMLGVVRTLMALSTLLTFLCNDYHTLFHPVSYALDAPDGGNWLSASSFFFLLRDLPEPSRWLVVAVMLWVIVGVLPQVSCFAHWWIACSFVISSPMIDGGDQVAAILSFLLLPVCCTDRRPSHWKRSEGEGVSGLTRLHTANVAWLLIRLQMAYIYFEAAVGKLSVTEWADGTALYYWMNNPSFGPSGPLKELCNAAFHYPVVLVTATWGAIAFQLLLVFCLAVDAGRRRKLLIPAVAFHCSIALAFGLITFSLVMCAGLILYLHQFRRVGAEARESPAPAYEPLSHTNLTPISRQAIRNA